ncbi:hypothetical protein LQ764DRAFT_223124 [Zygosaccharomyces rouxii]|nr:hypothetical protein LQ764DRAFT_223124 [Zygosaccharomyces rouxii]
MYTAPSGKVSGTLFGTDSSSDSTRTTMTVVPACTKTSEVFQCYTTADSTGLAPVHNPTFDYPGSIQSSNNGAFKASSEIANPIVQPSPSTITTEAVSCSSEATSYNEEASGNRTKKSITFEPSSGPSVLYPSTHTVTEFGSPAMIVTGKFETTVYVTCSCETDHWKSKQTDVAVTDQQLSSKSTIQDQGDQGIRTAFTTRTAHQVSASTSGVSESKSFTTNSSFSTVFGSTHIQASPTLSVYKGSATRMKLSFTALLLMLSWFF